MKAKLDKSLKEALVKKATGYFAEESVDEFAVSADTGEMKVVKRKITKKHVPPDLSAAKLLFEITGDSKYDLSAMSDAQLEDEKNRLEELLKNNDA